MSNIVESLYRVSLNESISHADVVNFGRALADKINSISNIYNAEFLDTQEFGDGLLVIRSDLTNKIVCEFPIGVSVKEIPVFSAVGRNTSINFGDGRDLEKAAGLVINNLRQVTEGHKTSNKAKLVPEHYTYNNRLTPDEFSSLIIKYAKLGNKYFDNSELDNDDNGVKGKKAFNIIKGMFDELELDFISDLESLGDDKAVIEHYKKYIDAVEASDYISKVGDSKTIHDGLSNLKRIINLG